MTTSNQNFKKWYVYYINVLFIAKEFPRRLHETVTNQLKHSLSGNQGGNEKMLVNQLHVAMIHKAIIRCKYHYPTLIEE